MIQDVVVESPNKLSTVVCGVRGHEIYLERCEEDHEDACQHPPWKGSALCIFLNRVELLLAFLKVIVKGLPLLLHQQITIA